MRIRKDKKNQTISDFQSITADESFSRFNNKNKHQAVEPIYTPEFIQKCVDYNNSILEKKFGKLFVVHRIDRGGPNIASLFTLNSNLSYKDFLNEDYGYLLLGAFDIDAVLPKTPQIYEKFI